MRSVELENAQRLLAEREVQLRENRIRMADFEKQLSQVRAQHLEAEEATERELLSLKADLSEIDLALQTESEIAVSEIRIKTDGRLMPRGFAVGQTIEAGETLFDLMRALAIACGARPCHGVPGSDPWHDARQALV